jgi:hypothetical protein
MECLVSIKHSGWCGNNFLSILMMLHNTTPTTLLDPMLLPLLLHMFLENKSTYSQALNPKAG